MEGPLPGSNTHLTWTSVALGLCFVVFDGGLSYVFSLKIGSSLIIAAIRCVAQLSAMALVLQSVLETNNPWYVAGIVCLLNLLGAFETVVNRSSRRYSNMFPSVLIAMFIATIPISLMTTGFLMNVEPFWKPDQYIPIVGMLAGATISGVVVSTTSVLRELVENRDKVETYLAFGATRFEACLPIAQQGLLVGLMPTVNSMSVIGLISIPGMMTGALLGGSSVDQASKLQMVIIFSISASSALGSIVAIIFCLLNVVDSEHRIRDDRIDTNQHVIWQICDKVGNGIMQKVRGAWQTLRQQCGGMKRDDMDVEMIVN